MILLLFPVACGALGFAVGRWYAVAAAIAVVAGVTVWLIANNGWYGAGWGDFGIEINVLIAALGIGLSVGGVALRKALA